MMPEKQNLNSVQLSGQTIQGGGKLEATPGSILQRSQYSLLALSNFKHIDHPGNLTDKISQ